ncbi:radical SAM family heme chaperone HemW [Butyrivibrio sp. NC2002]|uniref:radical SAM family heme chaperone HemW n=1 Tax=Butyrivibrio sp. NC2002 TaxID=1410610 RepID=UPI000690F070|nr:radical SAM family heme chaperone HemW [Butyrivibrio sp. NC2002]
MKKLGIYVHIPFCIRKCLYCDFLSFSEGEERRALYFDALKKEIAYSAKECSGYETESVFIGGGTPTSVDPDYITEIMKLLKDNYNILENAEITIECNPGTADFSALKKYREAGINRLSIGLQSANDDELKRLGRIHNRKQFEDCYQNARMAGFENVNVDLMSALPGQKISDWENNLNYVLGLDPKPEHISAYSLIIEEGTPFYDLYNDEACKDCSLAALPLPDEDTERNMYYLTKELLGKKGYHRYEISNYAAGTYECLHNKRYWECRDYIGFGIGAASLMNGVRYSNIRDMSKYISCFTKEDSVSDIKSGDEMLKDIRENTEKLTETAKMEEFMFLGLRMTKGVSIKEFRDKFGKEIHEIYGNVISSLREEGLLEVTEDSVRLTDKGMDVSNYCMAEFLL